MWSKTQVCRWNFDDIYHTLRVLPAWVTILLFPVVICHRNQFDSPRCAVRKEHTGPISFSVKTPGCFLADCTAAQYDRLLASSCRPSVCLWRCKHNVQHVQVILFKPRKIGKWCRLQCTATSIDQVRCNSVSSKCVTSNFSLNNTRFADSSGM